MKKLNAVAGLLFLIVMILHMGTMTYSLLTGWYNFKICKGLAHLTMIVACVHILLSLIIVFFLHEGTSIKTPGLNRTTIIQRVSALIIIILIHFHVKDFGFIVAHKVPTDMEKFFLILREGLFFLSLFAHISVSFSKAFISLGLVRKEGTVIVLDRIAFVFSLIMFGIIMFSVIRFVMRFGA